jgi:phosphoribosylglycinamide formyltransferase-1
MSEGTMAPRLLIFASGTKDAGGSGFANYVAATQKNTLRAQVVGVVSNHTQGGVARHADRLQIPFQHFGHPWDSRHYRGLVRKFDADFVALSGWLKPVFGLDPRRTFNTHPGPLPRFGGKGMYGRRIHEAVLEAYRKGEIKESAVTMHFVIPTKYDDGPIFFRHRVEIKADDTVETLESRVKAVEHHWQPIVTEMVLSGEICWDGVDPETLYGSLFI